MFTNQLNENFSFNYKIVIINCSLKCFFKYFVYIITFDIYLFSAYYISKGKLALVAFML